MKQLVSGDEATVIEGELNGPCAGLRQIIAELQVAIQASEETDPET